MHVVTNYLAKTPRTRPPFHFSLSLSLLVSLSLSVQRLKGRLTMKMTMVVEILTGTLFYIEVGDTATVADLKREIEAQEELPYDRLILILYDDYESRLLDEDDVPLADYGVRDGSHMYLFFEPVDHHLLLSAPACQSPSTL